LARWQISLTSKPVLRLEKGLGTTGFNVSQTVTNRAIDLFPLANRLPLGSEFGHGEITSALAGVKPREIDKSLNICFANRHNTLPK